MTNQVIDLVILECSPCLLLVPSDRMDTDPKALVVSLAMVGQVGAGAGRLKVLR